MFRLAPSRPFFAWILFVLLSLSLQAQETLTAASVTGRVLDPSGAAVPHASISALQMATNQTYTARTDDQGRFRLPYLPVGQYRISALANGFQEATSQAQLSVGAAFDLTLRLSLSQNTSNVLVMAQPPVIETDAARSAKRSANPKR